MSFKNQTYYFIGIGGIGMSSLARYLVMKGAQVFGYDKTPTEITNSLEELGISIVFDDSLSGLDESLYSKKIKIVYTPAIPKNHPHLKFFLKQGNVVLKRAELLGKLVQDTICLAVAGTHGKTTTTAILAHLFKQSKASFTAFVGGILQDSKTNMTSQGDTYTLVEADEFDRSFLFLNPTIACITSIDLDHLDIYADAQDLHQAYVDFASQVKDTLIVSKGLPLQGLTYSVLEQADFYVTNIKPDSLGMYFDLHTPEGVYKNQFFNQLGMHNLSNAVVAIAMAFKANLPLESLIRSLSTFPGVERRLQVLINTENLVLIDDYAHHPTEIKEVFKTLELNFSKDKKCVVFQPHLFSRTRDFMDDFASALSLFDSVLLLDIYPAREQPLDGITSQVLKNKIKGNKVKLISKAELYQEIIRVDTRIVTILGAGDIGAEVEGIKQKLKSNEIV